MRTTQGERQVDVIYRRIDDEFLDPVHFRPTRCSGVAGLLNAARSGHVVASGRQRRRRRQAGLHLYPTIIEYYLGENPLLANVDTFRCAG